MHPCKHTTKCTQYKNSIVQQYVLTASNNSIYLFLSRGSVCPMNLYSCLFSSRAMRSLAALSLPKGSGLVQRRMCWITLSFSWE